MASLLDQLQAALAPGYQVECEIARGGMGAIFLARDVALERPVAIKILRPDQASPKAAQRFLREARILASLRHPNVVPVHEAGEADGFSYYVMDYVEGETLAERLGPGPMPVDEVVKLGVDLLDALETAHRHGIVHRDVKPSNVFLVDDRAVLGDFGIAKRVDDSAPGLTAPGGRVGTPQYMPPEQITGQAGRRTDLYAVGMVLYEAATGRKWPIVATTEEADWSGVPRQLEHVLLRALEWSAKDRWPDAAAFRQALLYTRRSRKAPGLGIGVVATWIAVALIIAAGWMFVQRGGLGPPDMRMSRTRVAVLPFSVRGSDELAYLGEGMVDLLSATLDGAGDLRSVDARAVLGFVARGGGAALDPERGRAIAEQLGAGLYVLGNIVEVGGRLRLDASLYDPATGPDAVARGQVEGETLQLFALVDDLTAQLLADRGRGPGGRLTRVAAVTTGSLPALKAYLEGESAFRAGRFAPALEAFQRAVAEDSSFALAWYRLSIAGEWLNRADLIEDAADRALRYSDRLSEHDRGLLEAARAMRRGAATEAEQIYRTIVGTYQDDVEAWFQLGEVLFHFGPIRGRSIAQSREAWERVLFFEPEHVPAMLHLARIAASEGNPVELDSLVGPALELTPEHDRAPETLALRAFGLRDPDAQDRMVAALRSASDLTLTRAAFRVAVYAKDLAGAEKLARLLTEPSRSGEVQARGRIILAHLELARGRWRQAQRELTGAADPALAHALEYRALLSLAPFLSVPSSELRSLRSRLAALDAATVPKTISTSVFFAVHDAIHPHLRAYLLGLLSARQGEESQARRWATELLALGGPMEARALAEDLAQSVRAEVALTNGRTGDALTLLEGTRMEFWYDLIDSSPFYSQAYERFMRAELLVALERDEEALRWYSSFAEHSLYDLIYLAPSHRRRGEIYERLGQPETAAHHYERFIELWDDCDAELRPMVVDAERRLTRLASERAQ